MAEITDLGTTTIITLLVIASVVITIINSMCIYVIFHSQKLTKKPPTILISNLILTHMIQGILVIPTYALRKSKVFSNHFAEDIVCDTFRFTYMLTFYSATLNVLLLSTDRLLAVKLLKRYDSLVKRSSVLKVTVFSWIYLLLLCGIPFLPLIDLENSPHATCHYNQQPEWTIFMLITHAFVPYVFIIMTYVYVHMKISKLRQYFNVLNAKDFQSKQEKKKHERQCRKVEFNNKITKLTFLVICIYGITWAPSMTYYLLRHLYPSTFSFHYGSPTDRWISFLIKFVNFFDAIGAPIIYCYFHDEFRQEFKLIVMKTKVVTFFSNTDSQSDYMHRYSNSPV